MSALLAATALARTRALGKELKVDTSLEAGSNNVPSVGE